MSIIRNKKWDVFYNKKRKHPSITIKDKGNKWVNIKITHLDNKSPYIYKFNKNPNRNDNRESYVHSKLRYDHQDDKGNKYLNYKIHYKDKRGIKKKIKRTN